MRLMLGRKEEMLGRKEGNVGVEGGKCRGGDLGEEVSV